MIPMELTTGQTFIITCADCGKQLKPVLECRCPERCIDASWEPDLSTNE